jgi:hypothetical protein
MHARDLDRNLIVWNGLLYVLSTWSVNEISPVIVAGAFRNNTTIVFESSSTSIAAIIAP